MPRFAPTLASSSSWMSGSGSARPISSGISTTARSGTEQAEPARQFAGDDLGDERVHALSRAAELRHVDAVVGGLDEARHRAALAQRRHVAGRAYAGQRGGHVRQSRSSRGHGVSRARSSS